MKKTKIGVEIHKPGFNNSKVLAAVGAHNGEQIIFSYETMKGLILAQQVEYPLSLKDLFVTHEGESKMNISEDGGKTVTLSLTWKEVHELEPTPEDDLKGVLNGMPENEGQ